MGAQRRAIQAVVYLAEGRKYVAECKDLAVVAQGNTLDETVQNLREAVQLHLQAEGALEMGLSPDIPLLITM